MADLKTKLTLDGSDFTRGMNDASKSVEDFSDASKMSASELLNQMKSMDKLGRSTGNYRSQLAQISKQIQDLTINYRAMSDEMKNSEFGQAVAAKIQELTAKAGEFKDAIGDAQAAVKALSSDTAGWDAMKMGIDTVSGAMQGFVATGVLGANSTEKLVAVLAKLKAMEAATNAVIKIGNALQKQSALMMGVAKVQALALARAKQLETAATGKATIAQKLFNIVAKANPYVLLATAVIAVVSALAAFATKSAEAKRREEELQKQTELTQKRFEDFEQKVGGAVGNVVGKFKALQLQWSMLKTEAEKKKFIDDNAEAFRQLGLKINTVNDAQKTLVDMAPQVIAALKAQAEATGIMELYTQSQSEKAQALAVMQKKLNDIKQQYQAGELYFETDRIGGPKVPEFWRTAGLRGGDMYDDRDYKQVLGTSDDGMFVWTEGYRLTEEGARKLYEYVESEQKKIADQAGEMADIYSAMYDEAYRKAVSTQAEVSDLLDNTNNNNNNNNPTPVKQEVEVKYTKGSYAEAQAMVTQLQTDLNNMSFDDPAFGLVVAALDQWKQRAEEIKNAMGIVKEEAKPTAGSYAEAAAMVAMLTKELQNLDPSTEDFRNVKFELESWQETLDEIKKLMESTVEEAEELKKVDPFEGWKNSLSTIGDLESSMSGTYSAIKNIGKAFEECEDPIDALFTTIDNVLSLLNNVTSIVETINRLSEISVAIQLAKNMAEQQETREKIKQSIVGATNLSEEQAEAIAATVKASAEAGASASKIPYVGWILAIGAIAAIIAAISASKSSVSFAGGGIVPGSSFSGDFVHANLNSGEMVLNKTQQQKLFNMLEGEGSSGTGKVEFIIKGQELKGVLDNYDRKMSRV